MEDNENDFIVDDEGDDVNDDMLQALIHLWPMFEFGEEV